MNIMIGENIKRLRRAKEITQEQLAAAMNVTCAAVSKWERGETYPDITLLSPLAYFFGVTIDELMGYDEAKVEKRICDILEEYRVLYRTDNPKAIKLITAAYSEFPNDYRIMSRYMWGVGGDYADNNKETLLSHAEEFRGICDKILSGCNDTLMCADAYNMRGKLLWAEGKAEEAVSLYREKLTSWFSTWGQKSEQLFAKDTPEFLYWVKRNMYELANFTADKLSKSIFFNPAVSYADKVKSIESYGDKMAVIFEESGEDFFLVIAESVMGRLANDLRYRGGTPEDAARTTGKARALRTRLSEEKEKNPSLRDMYT